MNIEDLTIAQVKEILARFGMMQPADKQEEKRDPLYGTYVIIRTYSAGVHAGFLESQEGDVVMLKRARRLWSWNANKGVALNGVATTGLTPGCKVDEEVELARYTGVIETILCSEEGYESIIGY